MIKTEETMATVIQQRLAAHPWREHTILGVTAQLQMLKIFSDIKKSVFDNPDVIFTVRREELAA